MKSNLTLAFYGISEKDVIYKINGGNSIVYKCKNIAGEYVGIKEYLGDDDRRMRSMEREVASLNFLYENDITFAAQLISFNKKKPSICYKWIEGKTPRLSNLVKNQVIEALICLKSLYEHNPNFPLAIDAVASALELNKQIEQRIFIAKAYLKKYPEILISINKARELVGGNLFLLSKFPINTFSFSDIGVHNMITNSKSEAYFLDFEFFGADSKVKMVADLFSHPKTIFSREEIISLSLKLSLSDYEIEQLVGILPLIAIKWALITSRRLSSEVLGNQISTKQILEQINHYLGYSQFLQEKVEADQIMTFQEYKKMTQ